MLFQDNNIERAADWVFSHIDELQQQSSAAAEPSSSASSKGDNKNYRDGSGSESEKQE